MRAASIALVVTCIGVAARAAPTSTTRSTTTTTTTAHVTLADLVPTGLVSDNGLVLVMFTSADCPAAEAFAPTFVATASWLPGVRHRVVERTATVLALQAFSLPLFVLFRDGRPVDIHAGVDQQVSAQGTTWGRLAFGALAVRNGVSDGVPWALATTPWPTRASYHHASVKFAVGDGLSFSGADFRAALLSEVRLPRATFAGAVFDRTIMAHVDLAGAVLTDAQARDIVWVNAICPDGSSSRRHGDTCVGHTVLAATAR